jgi:tRNA(Ile)-lysidine synthase
MAHHAEDQAETVLMRMMRGCGIEGLGGMAPVSDIRGLTVYRPLLGVRRAELRAYLEAIGQGWREDETNASGRYTRNRVRAEVLPAMEEVAPGCVEAIGRLAAVARETWEIIEARVEEAWGKALVRKRGGRIVLRRDTLRRMERGLCAEVMRRAVELAGGSRETAGFERVEEAARLVRGAAGGARVEMGRGVVIQVGREVQVEAGDGR